MPTFRDWLRGLGGETWRTALDALDAYKMRALLSMTGVVIGSASIVLVVTAGLAGGRYVMAQIEGVGSNIAYAEHIGRRPSSAMSDELTVADMDAIRTQVPDVVDVAGARDAAATVVTLGQERAVTIIGVTDGFARIRHLVVTRGRYFDQDEIASGAKVCLLTEALASAMFPQSDAIGGIARVADLRLTVIGVFRERVSTFGAAEVQRESALVPLPLMRRITGADFVKVLYAQASSPDTVEGVTRQMSDVIRSRHRAGARYEVQNLTSLLAAARRISAAMTITLLAVAFVALLVSGIGIMNVMLATVRERTREIGVRKAVGAPRATILEQFLVEAGLISGIGAVLGVVLAIAVVALVRLIVPPGVSVPLSMTGITVALIASGSVGLVFGYMPARQAAGLNPVDALRYE